MSPDCGYIETNVLVKGGQEAQYLYIPKQLEYQDRALKGHFRDVSGSR